MKWINTDFMKRQVLVFLILLFANHTLSQEFTQKDLVGKWKVVSIVNKPENPNLKDIIKSFSSATFLFEENLNFRTTTLDKTEWFTMLINVTKDAKWKLNTKNGTISVGNDSNNYSILKLNIIKLGNQTIFHLAETDFNFEVKKQ
jgi:hypothetical protein